MFSSSTCNLALVETKIHQQVTPLSMKLGVEQLQAQCQILMRDLQNTLTIKMSEIRIGMKQLSKANKFGPRNLEPLSQCLEAFDMFVSPDFCFERLQRSLLRVDSMVQTGLSRYLFYSVRMSRKPFKVLHDYDFEKFFITSATAKSSSCHQHY